MHRTSILFVCHGNICRSPMAKYIARNIIAERHLEEQIRVDSAATSSEELGNGLYPPAQKMLSSKGVTFDRHVAHQITIKDYQKYDYIIAMDYANLRNLQRIIKADTDHKIKLLLDFTDRPAEVADPWYSRDFLTAYNEIERGVRALLDYICAS